MSIGGLHVALRHETLDSLFLVPWSGTALAYSETSGEAIVEELNRGGRWRAKISLQQPTSLMLSNEGKTLNDQQTEYRPIRESLVRILEGGNFYVPKLPIWRA